MIDPKKAVIHLCEEKYSQASVIFWAGSVATGNTYTSYSELDIVVIFNQVENAYR